MGLHKYDFVTRMSESLVRLNHPRFGVQIWSRGTSRKPCDCEDCRTTIPKGSRSYRPITNGYNRMHRLCESCITSKEQKMSQPTPTPTKTNEESGNCAGCGTECTSDAYCYGCKHFICESCEVGMATGFGHPVSDHLEELEDD